MMTKLGRLRTGLARLRYLRATLWLLPLDAFVLAVLGGAAADMDKVRPGGVDDAGYFIFVAFNLYLLAITLGRFGLAAWEATREAYRVLWPLAMLLWLVTLAVTLVMPANLFFLGKSAMGYDACDSFRCYALLPFIPPLISGVAVIAILAPTSALWFRLARPRV